MQAFRRVGRARFRRRVLWLLLVAAPACDDGPVIAPVTFEPAGTWNAVIFTATAGPNIHDLLELGGFITLELQAENVLSGRYAVPEFEDQLSDEFPISGTWTLLGRTTVRFEHSRDSYLSLLSFTGGGDQMTARGVIDGFDIHIVLER